MNGINRTLISQINKVFADKNLFQINNQLAKKPDDDNDLILKRQIHHH